jgi:hypothetical protein
LFACFYIRPLYLSLINQSLVEKAVCLRSLHPLLAVSYSLVEASYPFPFPFPRVCGWLKHDPIRRSRSMHAWYVGWVYRLLNLVENKSVVERKPFVFQFLSFVGDELQRNPKLRRFIFSS